MPLTKVFRRAPRAGQGFCCGNLGGTGQAALPEIMERCIAPNQKSLTSRVNCEIRTFDMQAVARENSAGKSRTAYKSSIFFIGIVDAAQ